MLFQPKLGLRPEAITPSSCFLSWARMRGWTRRGCLSWQAKEWNEQRLAMFCSSCLFTRPTLGGGARSGTLRAQSKPLVVALWCCWKAFSRQCKVCRVDLSSRISPALLEDTKRGPLLRQPSSTGAGAHLGGGRPGGRVGMLGEWASLGRGGHLDVAVRPCPIWARGALGPVCGRRSG